MTRFIVKGELKAYIKWAGRWRHAYIISSYDHQNLLGESVRMLQFTLTKNSKTSYHSEKINFQKNKPSVSRKGGISA